MLGNDEYNSSQYIKTIFAGPEGLTLFGRIERRVAAGH